MLVKCDGKINEKEEVDEVVLVMENGTWVRIEERPFGNYSITVEHKEK